ncbi:MAG TPA: tetratricopeptide repeat protein, partial [Planctomycetota bacterium]|nr:tetratricopeptide repeat protein [Planctomycetota bacterium]
GAPATDPRSGGRATSPTEPTGRRGAVGGADPRGSEGRGGRGASRSPGERKPAPRDPAPGESWRGRDHHDWSHDPNHHDHHDHHHDCHFHDCCPFFFGFSWGAWWWWDWWWWWWWTPHWHYAPVSETIYVPTYVPTTTVCEEGRTYAEPTTQESHDEDLATRQVRLADLYFRAGKYAEAAHAYRRAMEASPGTPSLHFTLADALFAAGDVGGAAKEIREGVHMDASLVAADVDKRGFYGKGEDFDLQVASLEARVAQDPSDRDGLLVLGYNYLFSGHPEKARATLESARALPGAGEAEGIFFAEADRRVKARRT